MRNASNALRTTLAALVLSGVAGSVTAMSVDDFEAGLPGGVSGEGIFTGFYTFAGAGSAGIVTTDMPPAPVPGAPAGNRVLQLTVDTADFAGFVHVFEGADVNTLAPRDWSAFGALSFWLYGQNTQNTLYLDVLDDRAGTGTYPFELWTTTFSDDFSGWRQLTIDFADLQPKDIGNGVPPGGVLGLTEVHGWALGTLATGAERSYYVDGVSLTSPVPEPGTGLLMGTALLAWLSLRRRRHAAAAGPA